jgi:hypothetical protein
MVCATEAGPADGSGYAVGSRDPGGRALDHMPILVWSDKDERIF